MSWIGLSCGACRLRPWLGLLVCALVACCLAGAESAEASTWSVVGAPVVRQGQLAAVWCVSPSECMAVGSARTRAGYQVGLAERWDGRRWSIARVPRLRGVVASDLRDVACVRVSDAAGMTCRAVGTFTTPSGRLVAVTQRWRDGRWSPARRIGGIGAPAGISCVADDACVAVGAAGAERWDGHRWSRLPGRRGLSFSDVSCWSRRACLAVGSDCCADAWWVERWIGSRRSAHRLGRLNEPDAVELWSVSCRSASECSVVGDQPSSSESTAPIALRWNGRTWSMPPAPDVEPQATLADVSCAAADECVAVGTPNGDTGGTLIERWNGRRWQVQPRPAPRGRDTAGILEGVSCPAAGVCLAVGAIRDGVRGASVLTERWTPGGPSRQRAPTPIGAVGGAFSGLSCTSASACMAVGQTVAAWNGRRWRLTPTPRLPDELGPSLNAVSCPSPRSCSAVGWAGSSDYPVPLAEQWNGRRWTVAQTPDPVRPIFVQGSPRFIAVSCISPRACTAVGSADRSGTPLVERWDGRVWSRQLAPRPAGAVSGELDAVSCTSRSRCMAVGSAQEPPGALGDTATVTLSEAWDGTGWTIEPTPSPAPAVTGFSMDQLLGVSCASTDACVAVGVSCDGPDCVRRPLAEAWNGSSWTITPIPERAGSENTLTSVSCATAAACTAVGTAQPRPGGRSRLNLAIAERWDGVRWVAEHVARSRLIAPMSGLSGTVFAAVSCPVAGGCLAAGSIDRDGAVVPMLESSTSR